MNQIERIEHFEKIFDESTAAIDNLIDALEKYAAVQEKYFELMSYYGEKSRVAVGNFENFCRHPAQRIKIYRLRHGGKFFCFVIIYVV